MRDLHTHIRISRAIAPASVTDNTPFVSQIIDTIDFETLEFAIAAGSLADADATFTALVEESDAPDMTGAVAVDDLNLLGTEAAASLTFADDNAVRSIGYVGYKRYVRLTITPANNTGAALISAIAIQSRPRFKGVA